MKILNYILLSGFLFSALAQVNSAWAFTEGDQVVITDEGGFHFMGIVVSTEPELIVELNKTKMRQKVGPIQVALKVDSLTSGGIVFKEGMKVHFHKAKYFKPHEQYESNYNLSGRILALYKNNLVAVKHVVDTYFIPIQWVGVAVTEYRGLKIGGTITRRNYFKETHKVSKIYSDGCAVSGIIGFSGRHHLSHYTWIPSASSGAAPALPEQDDTTATTVENEAPSEISTQTDSIRTDASELPFSPRAGTLDAPSEFSVQSGASILPLKPNNQK